MNDGMGCMWSVHLISELNFILCLVNMLQELWDVCFCCCM
jgi:hypothetical protein